MRDGSSASSRCSLLLSLRAALLAGVPDLGADVVALVSGFVAADVFANRATSSRQSV